MQFIPLIDPSSFIPLIIPIMIDSDTNKTSVGINSGTMVLMDVVYQ